MSKFIKTKAGYYCPDPTKITSSPKSAVQQAFREQLFSDTDAELTEKMSQCLSPERKILSVTGNIYQKAVNWQNTVIVAQNPINTVLSRSYELQHIHVDKEMSQLRGEFNSEADIVTFIGCCTFLNMSLDAYSKIDDLFRVASLFSNSPLDWLSVFESNIVLHQALQKAISQVYASTDITNFKQTLNAQQKEVFVSNNKEAFDCLAIIDGYKLICGF